MTVPPLVDDEESLAVGPAVADHRVHGQEPRHEALRAVWIEKTLMPHMLRSLSPPALDGNDAVAAVQLVARPCTADAARLGFTRQPIAGGAPMRKRLARRIRNKAAELVSRAHAARAKPVPAGHCAKGARARALSAANS